MREVFEPMYNAIGRQHHTLYGGAQGVAKAFQKTVQTLGAMVSTQQDNRKRRAYPTPEYFNDILQAAEEEGGQDERLKCSQYIVSQVRI